VYIVSFYLIALHYNKQGLYVSYESVYNKILQWLLGESALPNTYVGVVSTVGLVGGNHCVFIKKQLTICITVHIYKLRTYLKKTY
jgi:hypothetical protein